MSLHCPRMIFHVNNDVVIKQEENPFETSTIVIKSHKSCLSFSRERRAETGLVLALY